MVGLATHGRGGSEGRMHVTPRQAQILRLIALGLSDKEIASSLGVSSRTVQTHLVRLYQEHGLHTRAAAVAFWLEKTFGISALPPVTPR